MSRVRVKKDSTEEVTVTLDIIERRKRWSIFVVWGRGKKEK